jgi:GGDEF domain-containing protein
VTGPATAAVLLSASTLISIGVEHRFSLRVALQASAAVAAAAWTLAAGVRRRTRQRRAVAALGRDGTASSALAAAGIGGWVARLDWDPDHECYVATIDREAAPSPEDLAETLARALRPGTAPLVGLLSSGTPFTLTPPAGDEPRLAVGGARLCGFEQRLLGTIAASLSCNDDGAAGPRLASITEHDRDATRPYALILVDMGAFENVRLVAGQLSAERVAAEAAERLYRLIRRGDQVAKIGDDRFGVLMAIDDESELEAVCARIRAAISAVSIPRRALAIRPKITAAIGAAAWADPELAAVAAAFSDRSSQNRIAV